MKIEEFEPQNEVDEGDRIREYLNSVEFGGIEYKAFCDCVDLGYAEVRMRTAAHHGAGNVRGLEEGIALIGETIRQRQNEIPGYQKAYRYARKISDELISSIGEDSERKINPLEAGYRKLILLKREHIEKFNK